MFADFDRRFMSDNMKIVVGSIESKLNEPIFFEFKEIVVKYITECIGVVNEIDESGVGLDTYPEKRNKAEDCILALFLKITDGMERNEVYEVIDNLRYSFSCYASGGLHQLYTRQENESWHPKIKLTEVLEPNDIESLPQAITLYRGCDISELANKSFGQAWSTSLEVAKKFAHEHYENQKWFDAGRRVVLEAKCFKEHVLFSDQKIEFEVVVNAENLNDVRKYK